MKNRLIFPLWALAHVQRLAQAQNAEAWASLNTSVGGRLHPDTPLALPCFSLYNGNPVELDEGACSVVRENYTTNSIRAEHPGGYMNLQSEFCLVRIPQSFGFPPSVVSWISQPLEYASGWKIPH